MKLQLREEEKSYLKNREIIVKSIEEECGEEYFVVTVPDDVSDDELDRILNMAAEYATIWTELNEFEGREAYDEHYEKMKQIKLSGNGQDVFNAYLELYGCKVEYLRANFVYEW